MGLFRALLTGQSEAPAGRTPKERARRAKEISKIEAGTSAWLRRGGRGPRWEK